MRARGGGVGLRRLQEGVIIVVCVVQGWLFCSSG